MRAGFGSPTTAVAPVPAFPPEPPAWGLRAGSPWGHLSVPAAVPPPASGARGWRPKGVGGSFTLLSLRAAGTAGGRGNPSRVVAFFFLRWLHASVCQAFPRGCPPPSAGRGAGEAEVGLCRSCPRRAPECRPAGAPLCRRDRCGSTALSWAGPKPRQARDGRSWRTGPIFSSCPRAPRLSTPPAGGAWKAGVRTPARPRASSPCPSRSVLEVVPGFGGRGLFDVEVVPRLPVARAVPSVGGAGPSRRRASRGVASALPPLALRGASGALRVVPRGARG